MKTQHFIVSVVAAALTILVASSSNATAITINSSYLLGTTPGSPSSPGDELSRLQALISEYNGGTLTPAPGINVPAAPLPDATVNHGQVNESTTSFDINLGTSQYDYLMVKWADTDAFYYIGGLSGTLSILNDLVFNKNNKAQDASHYDLFNPGTTPVPDGGTTALLLGAALSAIGLIRRKLRSHYVK